jgi:hypothetical protein
MKLDLRRKEFKEKYITDAYNDLAKGEDDD